MEVIASEFPDLYQWFETPKEVVEHLPTTEASHFDIDLLTSR